MKSFGLCEGIDADMCANCQRWFKNNAEADVANPKQPIIQAPDGPHCAYYMPDHKLSGPKQAPLRFELQDDVALAS